MQDPDIARPTKEARAQNDLARPIKEARAPKVEGIDSKTTIIVDIPKGSNSIESSKSRTIRRINYTALRNKD